LLLILIVRKRKSTKLKKLFKKKKKKGFQVLDIELKNKEIKQVLLQHYGHGVCHGSTLRLGVVGSCGSKKCSELQAVTLLKSNHSKQADTHCKNLYTNYASLQTALNVNTIVFSGVVLQQQLW